MPTGGFHDFSDCDDIFIRNSRINRSLIELTKTSLGLDHLRWFKQFFRHKAKVKSFFIGMVGYSAEPFSERFRIAMFTARTNLGATPHWVPRCVRPFDFRILSHSLFIRR